MTQPGSPPPSPLPPLFDAHTHLHLFPPPSLPPLLADAAAAGVRRYAVCGTQESDWQEVAALAASSGGTVAPSFGIHPWRLGQATAGWEERLERALIDHPSAGVGESGLDKAPRGTASAPPAAQRAATAAHARLALAHGRPLTLHCVRSTGALADVLEAAASPAGFPAGAVVHAWRGGADAAARLLRLPGVHLSLGARSVAGVAPGGAAWLPLDRVLLETDADGRSAKTVSTDGNAFAAVPADLPAVAAAVATAMGVDVAVVAGAATRNARRVFGDGEGAVW